MANNQSSVKNMLNTKPVALSETETEFYLEDPDGAVTQINYAEKTVKTQIEEAKPQVSAAPVGVGFSYMGLKEEEEIAGLIGNIRQKLESNSQLSELQRIKNVLEKIEGKFKDGKVLAEVFELAKGELNRINNALDPQSISDKQEYEKFRRILQKETVDQYVAGIVSTLHSGILSSNSELFDEELLQAKENTELARSKLIYALNKAYEAEKEERNTSWFSSSTPLKLANDEHESFRASLAQFGIGFDAERTPPFSSETENFWISLNVPYVRPCLPEGTFFSSKNKEDEGLEIAIREFNDSLFEENIVKVVTAMQSVEIFKMFAELGKISSDLERCDFYGIGLWSKIAKNLQEDISRFAEKSEGYGKILQEQKGKAVQHLKSLQRCLAELNGSSIAKDRKNHHSAFVKTIVGLLQYKLFLADKQTSFASLSQKAEEIIRSVEIPFDEEILIDLESCLLNLVVDGDFILKTSEALKKAELEFCNLKEQHKNRHAPLFRACAALSEAKSLQGIVETLEGDKNLNKEERFLIVAYLQAFAAWRFNLTEKDTFTVWAKDFIEPLAELAEAQGKTGDPLAKAKALIKVASYASVPFSEHINSDSDTAGKIKEDIKTLHAILDKIFELHKQYPFSKEDFHKITATVAQYDISAEEKSAQFESIYAPHHQKEMQNLGERIATAQMKIKNTKEKLRTLEIDRKQDSEDLASLPVPEEIMKQELEDSAGHLSAAEKAVKDAQDSLSALHTEQKKDAQKIEELKQKKKELEDEEKLIHGNVENLKEGSKEYVKKKSEYEQAINDFQIKINPVENKQAVQAAKIVRLTDDLDVLQAEAGKLEGELKKLQGALATNEEKLKLTNEQKNISSSELETKIKNIPQMWNKISDDIKKIIHAHKYVDINYSGIGSVFGFNKKDKSLAQAFSDFQSASEGDKPRALWTLYEEIITSLKRQDLSKERRGTLNAFLTRLDGKQRDTKNCKVSNFIENTSPYFNVFNLLNENTILKYGKIYEYEDSIKTLREENENLKKSIESLKEPIERIMSDITEITRDITAAEKEQESLTTEIDKLKSEKSVVEKKLLELGAEDSKASALAQKEKELDEKREKIRVTAVELVQLDAAVENRISVLADAATTLKKQESGLAAAQDVHKQKSAKQKTEREDIEKKIAALSDKIIQNQTDTTVNQKAKEKFKSEESQLKEDLAKLTGIGQPISAMATRQTLLHNSASSTQQLNRRQQSLSSMNASAPMSTSASQSAEEKAEHDRRAREAKVLASLGNIIEQQYERDLEERRQQEAARIAEEHRQALEEKERKRAEEAERKRLLEEEKQEQENKAQKEPGETKWKEFVFPGDKKPLESYAANLNHRKETQSAEDESKKFIQIGMKITATHYLQKVRKCEIEFQRAVGSLKQDAVSQFLCDPDTPKQDADALNRIMVQLEGLKVRNEEKFLEEDFSKLEKCIEEGYEIRKRLNAFSTEENKKSFRQKVADTFGIQTKAVAEDDPCGYASTTLDALNQARKELRGYEEVMKAQNVSLPTEDEQKIILKDLEMNENGDSESEQTDEDHLDVVDRIVQKTGDHGDQMEADLNAAKSTEKSLQDIKEKKNGGKSKWLAFFSLPGMSEVLHPDLVRAEPQSQDSSPPPITVGNPFN